MTQEFTFGEWLRRRRRALDLTQDELAKRVGLSSSAIRKIESDERRPSRQVAALLADALAIPEAERARFLQRARLDPQAAATPAPTPAAAPPPAVAPPAKPSPPPLPIPLTPIIGREAELAQLVQLLQTPDCRLLTILGPGGIGKTRLALQVAQQILDSDLGILGLDRAEGRDNPNPNLQNPKFPNGVFFVPLAGVSTPEAIAPTIAAAVGAALNTTADVPTQLIQFLAPKTLLLVLDNLEQLLAAPGATTGTALDLLSELLQQAPGVKLLTTSREPLTLAGEWVFDLQGLPAPPLGAAHTGGSLEERYSAVALFLQMARRVQANLQLTAEDEQAVARICALVEGLPLALELAASWVRTLSCTEIADEITRSIDFLAMPLRARPERHHSITAVFDHSWRLLEPAEQRVLRRLAIFRGGFLREAAQAVADATLLHLSALVSKSLVRFAPTGRYDLHELVRQYADEKLAAAGEADAVRQRHFHYFLALAETAEPQLSGAEQIHWLNRLAGEYDNLRAALNWAMAQPEAALALRLTSALRQFWEVRGYVSEGRQWLNQALARSQSESPALRLQALQAAGQLALEQHDLPAAQSFFSESLAISQALPESPALAAVLYSLGRVAWLRRESREARTYYEAALARYREQGDRQGVARVLNGLGLVTMSAHELDDAARFLEESVALDEALGNHKGRARSLFNLGMVYVRMEGGAAQAIAYFEASIALCRELGYAEIEAYAANNLAMMRLHEGDVAQAMRLAQKSLELCQQLEYRLGAAYALINLAHGAIDQADLAAAARSLRASLRWIEQVQGHTQVEVNTWWLEAAMRLVAARGQPELAVQLAGAAATWRRDSPDSLPPTARAYLQPTLDALQRALDKETFAAAWAAGAQLTIPQTVQLVF
jgi:predicted ATPase/transcriptional regulator with XRE-family HTH domain